MIKIFVIEDDEGIRELIKYLLEDRGYSIQTFPNVKTFQKKITEYTPDLFLLDIMLPDGNGLNLCKELKRNERTRNIPVILMSAHYRVNKPPEADDFLPKPFDIEELLERINYQVNLS